MESLRDDIPLLYRVTTARSHIGYTGGGGFTIPRSRSPRPHYNVLGIPSRQEVMAYINDQYEDFQIIVTTASLAIALWWADKQSSQRKGDIRIAVIDATQVAQRTYTALECIRPEDGPRDESIYKCENFARSMQFIFVKGDIPACAVLSAQSWDAIVMDLPSWYCPQPGK